MQSKALNTTGRGKLVLALLALAGVFAAEVVAVFVVLFCDISDESLWAQVIPELFGAAAAVAGVMLLGGRAWASVSRDDVGFTFCFGWWCMAISVALAVYDLAVYVLDATPFAADWPVRLVECALLCLLIGILEEFMFRGLVLGGLLAVMGGTHKGVVRAVLLTSLFFGMAHVDFETDFVDVLSAVQAVLKIVQTGLYSILLCVIVLRTRRLGGVSLFHALDDFVIIAPGVALFDEPVDIEYVVQGDEAVPAILYYLLVIALYLPFVVKALRELRRGHDVYRGPFMELAVAREEERLHLQQLASQQGLVGAGEEAPVGGGPVTSGLVPPSYEQRADGGRPPAPRGL